MNKHQKIETATTPKSDNIQTTLPGNPYKGGTVMKCAIKGTRACQDHDCDGYNRRCTVWLRHSCR